MYANSEKSKVKNIKKKSCSYRLKSDFVFLRASGHELQ